MKKIHNLPFDPRQFVGMGFSDVKHSPELECATFRTRFDKGKNDRHRQERPWEWASVGLDALFRDCVELPTGDKTKQEKKPGSTLVIHFEDKTSREGFPDGVIDQVHVEVLTNSGFEPVLDFVDITGDGRCDIAEISEGNTHEEVPFGDDYWLKSDEKGGFERIGREAEK